jgi:hypothetical protein
MRNIKTREAKKLRGSEIKRFSSSQLLVLWNFRVSDLLCCSDIPVFIPKSAIPEDMINN